MKTTLINCAVKTSTEYDGARVPQGCLYLLSAAKNANFDIKFRDYQLEKLNDPLNTFNFLKFVEDDADVLAISCMSNLLPLVVNSTKIFKESYPDKTIVLGGIGPSGVAESLMAEFPHIDVIVRGEGERTFPELLKALEGKKSLESVEGLLLSKENGTYHITRPRKRIENLNDLPFPGYDQVDMNSYETVGIQTARGCPFPCNFCDVSAYWGHDTTYRSLDLVIKELELLEKQYGFMKVVILDDTFILNKRRVFDFCKAYRDRGLTIQWSAYCRVDLLSDEMIEIFEKSGCYRIFLGVESGSNNVLRRISKPIDIDRLIQVVKKAHNKFIVRINLIWGFPFESMKDLKDSVFLLFYLKEFNCDVSMALLSPLPLSRLYNEKKYRLIFREDLQSSVVSSRFYLPNGNELVNGKPDILVDLVRKHPDIFPGFYVFEDKLFEQKLEYLNSLGLEIEKLTRQ
ncbi:MAG: B12-binding domain-containing radical SAM protein [Candidatus Brocadia sp.]|nr:B12-binding domain-containing radical SAM protein [Candidatus Brocadia sp.]